MANGRQTFLLDAGVNGRVLAVTMGLALLTRALFGLDILQLAKAEYSLQTRYVRTYTHGSETPNGASASLTAGLVFSILTSF
jgi:hypothetical protein